MIIIKITGEGTLDEVIQALESLKTSLSHDFIEEDFETPKTFEDETLLTIISKKDE